MKKKIVLLISVIISIVILISIIAIINSDIPEIAEANMKGRATQNIENSFTNCPEQSTFECLETTQGSLCGCIPQCGGDIIAGLAEGSWPDGSLKGSFLCSNS